MKVYPVLLIMAFSLTTNIYSQVQFASHTIVGGEYSAFGASSVYAIDVDGDGDIDAVSASADDNKIAWYENDGNENFTPHTITTSAFGAKSVYAIDVDGDGDIDVLSASYTFTSSEIAWYENDGNENFSAHSIATGTFFAHFGAHSVYAVDIDSDGDIDVLSTSAWYENDGNENFASHTIQSDFPLSVYAADVDGDGDIDVLFAYNLNNKIDWYENDGNENFVPHTIYTFSSSGAREASSVFAIDVDGDGDIDVLSASASFGNPRITWYENTDGRGSFGLQQVITTNVDGAFSVYAADLDSDGDIDVLSASFIDDKIAWYENLSLTTAVHGPATEISEFALLANYPNPFNPETIIRYELPKASEVTIAVYNLLGQKITELVNEHKPAGSYEVNFDASALSSGVYLYRIQTPEFQQIKKMLLVK